MTVDCAYCCHPMSAAAPLQGAQQGMPTESPGVEVALTEEHWKTFFEDIPAPAMALVGGIPKYVLNEDETGFIKNFQTGSPQMQMLVKSSDRLLPPHRASGSGNACGPVPVPGMFIEKVNKNLCVFYYCLVVV